MTALLEYLNLALAAHSWFLYYNSPAFDFSKSLKGPFKLINPSMRIITDKCAWMLGDKVGASIIMINCSAQAKT